MLTPFTFQIEVMEDFRGKNCFLYDAKVASQLPEKFHIVQINQGLSIQPFTLRGLHYQVEPYAQAKLCYALTGSVFNAAVNLCSGEVFAAELHPGTAMFIPRGYAHGYLTLEPNTLFQWCVDNNFCSEATRILHYDCVDWPIDDWSKAIISDKDKKGEKIQMACGSGRPRFYRLL